MDDVVLVGAARTPIACFQGALAKVPAPQLGARAIAAALERAGLDPDAVDEVIMGQVLGAGVGQAPARQAARAAEIPDSVHALTINKVCGSGLKAVMLGRQAIQLGESDVVLAGGMESMSCAPYLLPGARAGLRMGPGHVVDAMIHDGLWDPYNDQHMGCFGDRCAVEEGFGREEQDAYAARSYQRAQAAVASGAFAAEIAPVSVRERKGERVVDADEEPGKFQADKIGALRPAFGKEGSITAANASKLSDGAAAVALCSRATAERRGLPILARIVAHATHTQEPERFTTAPIGAIRSVLDRAGMQADQVDAYEINEAFSVVAMAASKAFALDEERVNMRGGAVSLGHPIGCSGARLLVTLLHILKDEDLRSGCVSLCIGGGEAVAMIVERE